MFRPLDSNEVVLGAIGLLQFDVVAHRLRHEYGVECTFEAVPVATARWIFCEDNRHLEEFMRRSRQNLALDASGALAYIAPNAANLRLAVERWPDVEFRDTREL